MYLINVLIDDFTAESIGKMAKVVSNKFGDKAIEILSMLQMNDLLNRTTICSKLKNSQPIVDKWLDSLEATTAIEAKKVGTSYVYSTTKVGSEILKNLIKEKEAKKEEFEKFQ